MSFVKLRRKTDGAELVRSLINWKNLPQAQKDNYDIIEGAELITEGKAEVKNIPTAEKIIPAEVIDMRKKKEEEEKKAAEIKNTQAPEPKDEGATNNEPPATEGAKELSFEEKVAKRFKELKGAKAKKIETLANEFGVTAKKIEKALNG